MTTTRNLLVSFAIATTVAVLPAAAQANEKNSFTDRGTTYEYRTQQNSGRTTIVGTTDAGDSYRLVVNDKHVTGLFNGRPVTFRLSQVRTNEVAVR